MEEALDLSSDRILNDDETLLNKTHNSLITILPFLRTKMCVDIHASYENDIQVCLSFTRIHPSFVNYIYTQAHTTEMNFSTTNQVFTFSYDF